MRSSPVQLSLFSDLNHRILASGGFVAGMKAAMREIVDASGLSRDHVIDAMNDIVRATGKGLCKGSKFISLSSLEKWLADEERGQLPDLWGMHVLLLATGSNLTPLEAWLSFFGCSILDETGKDKLEFAEMEIDRERRERRRKELKTKLMERK